MRIRTRVAGEPVELWLQDTEVNGAWRWAGTRVNPPRRTGSHGSVPEHHVWTAPDTPDGFAHVLDLLARDTDWPSS